MIFLCSRIFCASVFCTALPVASATCTIRRWLWPPSRVKCKLLSASRVNSTPWLISHSMASRACVTTLRVISASHKPAPAIKVSLICASILSWLFTSLFNTAAMPPCAQLLALSDTSRLLTMQTFLWSAICNAMVSPARPLPIIRVSNCCFIDRCK